MNVQTEDIRDNHPVENDYEGRFTTSELASLLEIAADWTYETDSDDRFSWVSESVRKFGGTPSFMVGLKRKDVFEQIAISEKDMRVHFELIADRKPYHDCRGAYTDRNGRIRYFTTSGTPRYDKDGVFCGYRGMCRDLTEVVASEAGFGPLQRQLERSRSLMMSIFSVLESAVVVYDANDRLIMANDATRKLYKGVPREYLVPGATLRSFLEATYDAGLVHHSDDSDLDRTRWVDKRVQWYHEERREYDVVLANGRWLHFQNLRLPDGTFVGLRTDITTLKEREFALQEALNENSLAKEILDGLDQAVFAKDDQMRFVIANKTMLRLLGKTEDDVLGKTAFDIHCAEDARCFEHGERQVLETGNPLTELESSEENNHNRWHSIWKNRIETEEGKRYVAGFISDVTQIKQGEMKAASAHAEAEAARRRLQDAIDAIQDGFVLWDSQDRLVACNEAFRQQLANVPELEPGRSFEEIFRGFAYSGCVPDAVGREEAWIAKRVAQRDKELGSEVVLKDFDSRWIMKRDKLTGSGDRVGIRTDITLIKEREEEARQANQLLQDAVDAMDEAFVIFDVEDRLMMVNKTFRLAQEGAPVTVGMTYNELVSTLAEHHVHEKALRHDWIKRQLDLRAEALTADGPLEVERSDGRWHVLDVRRTSSGATLDIRSEITSKKMHEIALKEARNRAELADRAKSEFLANMSHEIRTPMNGVLSVAELLAQTSLNDKQRTLADIIVKSGNALLTIINDILDFSKIDAGHLVLSKQPFNLADAVSDVATLMSARAKEKELELIVRIDPQLDTIYVGDVGRFRQIITNLVGNAVKFTDAGHVLVDVKGIVSGNRTRLRISVSDTGVGIPESKLACIFEKFSQVDSSSTRVHEGTGLGLAITTRLAELMNGSLSVESKLGEGSTFHVELELANDKERTKTVETADKIAGARVVIVDDNDLNRSVLLEQMRAWGLDVCAAKSGKEGLALLKATVGYGLKVDCLVLDYQMPGMSGTDVVRAIRNDHTIADVPIIILSSVDQASKFEDVEDLGISAALIKPARPSALLASIKSAVKISRQGGLAPAMASATDSAVQQTQEGHNDLASPARSSDETPTATKPEADHGAQHRIDVLVAEDNEVNQLVLTQILSDTEYSFNIVTNGELALEAWSEMSPRIVLMDVSMPVMNGLEATAHIRRSETRNDMPRTPIIGVTAHALKGDRERCLESGMDDYLSKPISPDALLRKINEWLEDEAAIQSKAG